MVLDYTVFEKFPPEAVKCVIFESFFKFDIWQLEVASDIISGLAVQYISVEICVKFDDSRSNRSTTAPLCDE